MPETFATSTRRTCAEDAPCTTSESAVATSLWVVGIGIQWAGQTTAAAKLAIEGADRVLFAVADPWAAAWVRSLNSACETLRYPRDGQSRVTIYADMVKQIMEALERGGRVCAVFYGSAAVLTEPAHAAIRAARTAGVEAHMLPGVSFMDCLFAELGVDPAHGCQIYEAGDFIDRARTLEPRVSLILSQLGMIGNRRAFDPSRPEQCRVGMQKLSAALRKYYDSDHVTKLYEAAAHPLAEARIEPITVGELATARVGEVTTLYVPPCV